MTTDDREMFDPTEPVYTPTVRSSKLFEVFLTPLNLPLDEDVLGVNYGDLSRVLRTIVTAYDVDYSAKTVSFSVVKDGLYDLAFIKALQADGIKEILIYQYNKEETLIHTLVVSAYSLRDYTLSATKDDEQWEDNRTAITVNANVDFRIK